MPNNQYLEQASQLPVRVRQFVLEKADLCQPDAIHVCDGSDQENDRLIKLLVSQGAMKPLLKYQNCWLVRTDPADVARVESKTVISTTLRSTTIPTPADVSVQGKLGRWMSVPDMECALADRFPGCMKGRTMYIVPFSMGPVGGPLSKIGVELTDSPYVVASMRIMTRIGRRVLDIMNDNTGFVKATHSVGLPLPTTRKIVNGWPCDPERTLIAHLPEKNEICSFGSGYGGNSLLGKKCFALRLGSILARDEGWLAEHMLILGITEEKTGKKTYLTAAFPSACGKTNLAMLQPTIPGLRVECVGDDIAWMKFDAKGTLRAINPEAGFFGVAPGTSDLTNPHAMSTLRSNTIFTNVAETSDGGFFWEGLEESGEVDLASVSITDWQGQPWTKNSGRPAAHPNSRFCCPAAQCPIIDPAWESPDGVPISAIVFGGRRPRGVPLVLQARSWAHGVFLGAGVRSETTAAAEHKGSSVMHDPFAMRPFFGYNFGHYVRHWLSFADVPGLRLPEIFHVNWFRRADADNSFLWPGFGENVRVLAWILARLWDVCPGFETPAGIVPLATEMRLEGLEQQLSTVRFQELCSQPALFWAKELDQLEAYFREQVGDDLPEPLWHQLRDVRARFSAAAAAAAAATTTG